MMTTLEGIFRDGRVELREPPPGVVEARVLVTFLPAEEQSAPLPPTNRQMLAVLEDWKKDPLTAEDERILDDFEEFRKAHPFSLHSLNDET